MWLFPKTSLLGPLTQSWGRRGWRNNEKESVLNQKPPRRTPLFPAGRSLDAVSFFRASSEQPSSLREPLH